MLTEEEIDNIAESLDAGMVCFVHRKNKTLIEIPEQAMDDDPDGFWKKDLREVEKNAKHYVEIERMDSNEAFRVMADFARTISDDNFRRRVDRALSQRKPFQNFRYEIDNSGTYREQWFDYKKQRLVEWVKSILEVNDLYTRPEEEEQEEEETRAVEPALRQTTTITASEIELMEFELADAIRLNKVNDLKHLLHDELLAIAPNGLTITKEMDLASHAAGEMVVHKLKVTVEETHIIDDTAICTVVYDTKGRMMGEPIAGKFKYLRVWKKFDDGFKVIAASCFKIP